MLWGTELWDGYDKVVSHVTSGATSLGNKYEKFFREKADIEAEYARGLRRLVTRYQPRAHEVSDTSSEAERPEEAVMFSRVLEELGYIAGQHEMVAEQITRDIVMEMRSMAEELSMEIKRNVKCCKKEKDKYKLSLFDLEKNKLKYLKSYHDWEDSEASYQASEKDGTIARNEILRLKLESETKHKKYVQQTEMYQKQLQVTNSDQNNYFTIQLPNLLDKLETVERNRLNFVKSTFNEFIDIDNKANTIVNKCRNDMATSVSGMEVERDINLVVDFNKSGDLPPQEIPFIQTQQLRDKKVKVGSISRRLTLSSIGAKQASNKQNLYQKKRKISKIIDARKSEFEKCTKEVQALQVMIDAYKENPEYGSVKKFQQELKAAVERVTRLDTELTSLNRELDLVESSMCLNIRHSLASQLGSDGGSQDSEDTQGHEDTGDWSDDNSEDTKVLALYDYTGEEAGTLVMEAGEELTMLEEDSEGWIRVRRAQTGEEGFVPTGYTSPITVLNC